MKIKRIIIHHSLTADGKMVNWGAIRRYHVKQRGWHDIGYHYGIELVDYDYEILVGRFECITGAHVRGHNKDTLGICVVGNWDKLKVPKQQWDKAILLVQDILKRHSLKASDVYGHCEFARKSCPGKNFDMDKFRKDLCA